MAVLNTLLSPNFWAKVAASLNTPPSLPPTSCPYNKHSGCFAISSSMANNAQSTITTLSAPFGVRSPTSCVIGVGAKSWVNKSSAEGSSAAIALLRACFTRLSISDSIVCISALVAPCCRSSASILGYGSSDLACFKSSL